MCGCEGVGVLWGFLVCEGVRVFLCVFVILCDLFVCLCLCVPSLRLVCVFPFGCVLRFRFLCVFLCGFLCGFLCFNGFPFAVLKMSV